MSDQCSERVGTTSSSEPSRGALEIRLPYPSSQSWMPWVDRRCASPVVGRENSFQRQLRSQRSHQSLGWLSDKAQARRHHESRQLPRRPDADSSSPAALWQSDICATRTEYSFAIVAVQCTTTPHLRLLYGSRQLHHSLCPPTADVVPQHTARPCADLRHDVATMSKIKACLRGSPCSSSHTHAQHVRHVDCAEESSGPSERADF